MRRLAALVGVAALAFPEPAVAASRWDDGKPFPRGTLVPTLGLGGRFGGDLNILAFGGGVSYFVWHGVGLGLSFDDTVLIYSRRLRAELPGIEDQLPNNIFRLTPNIMWAFVRTRWFTPYVTAGIGPVFFNNGGGTFGYWLAGAGALIGVGGPVFIDLGVNFSRMFPVEQCRDAFLYTYPDGARDAVLNPCEFVWGPRLGLVLAFGIGGKRRRERTSPAPPPAHRPERPPVSAEPWPEPAPLVEPAPVPTPAAEAEPTDAVPPVEPAADDEPSETSEPGEPSEPENEQPPSPIPR